MSRGSSGFVVRRATALDLPAILALGGRSLGWRDDDATAAHFAWKHSENPFGRSPMWVAEADDRIVGFRTFLHWELSADGDVLRAVRAVDTATDPGFQGRGIFTRLTLAALDELRADGVDFVFNTPNDQSRPGYLKMGWTVVGRLPVGVRPTRLRGIPRMLRARTPADRGAVPTDAGVPAATVLADRTRVEALLAAAPRPAGLATHRTPAYLAWRYGPPALHYRVVAAPDGPEAGAVVFHLRRRGPALEAVVCEQLIPPGAPSVLGRLLTRVAGESGADYLLRLRAPGDRPARQGFWPLPRVGPVLTAREVTRRPAPTLAGWALSLGDVELF
ncbi:MAG: GNAT family N-acetyltransferase [Acidimicrobiia bacterium]|jgi:GNAT superfamily N-acetyltransferase